MEIDVWYDVRNPQQWQREPAALYAETLEQIAWADTLGFGAAWLSEHHFTDEGYLPGLTAMLGAMAMRTTRMRLGTAVLLAPLYHPLRLAEEMAVVDALSGGRLDLGIAPGYRLKEFEVMGVPKAERGTRTDEIIELLIAAWTTPRVTYRGRHFQFDDVAVAPKPVQQPHPPLWIGGSTPAAARRAARFGANFMPDSGAPVEVFELYRDECAAAGRPVGEVATNLVVHVCDDPERGWNDVKEHYFYVRSVYQQWFAEAGDLTQVDDSVRVADDLPRGAYVVGTPDMVIEAIERRREGREFDRLIFWARPPGIDIETSSRSLELMATKVLPHFAARRRRADRETRERARRSRLLDAGPSSRRLGRAVGELQEYLPSVKQRVSPDVPSAVSLRLSAATVERLLADESALADLRAFLSAEDLYVVTANAFPYGPFKNRLVMETVFEPDWRDRRRAEYTKGVATILSSIAGDGVSPTIQTAPLGFKPHVTPGVVERFTEHVLKSSPTSSNWRGRRGRRCVWASSPSRSATWRRRRRRSATSARSCSPRPRRRGWRRSPVSTRRRRLRRYGATSASSSTSATRLSSSRTSAPASMPSSTAEVPIVKLQVAAAMRVPEVTPEIVEQLGQFTETVYLSQTMERRGDGPIRRFLNLRDAMTCWEPGEPTEWRTHFHVPVFLDDLDGLGTTRFAIAEALAKHRATPLSDQVEIETYTWDVLPAQFKTGDIVEYVERELTWVLDQLGG